MEEWISRKEHEEFCRRMETENRRLEDENDRQNHRIDILEKNVLKVQSLATSVEKLAINMESMLKEQEKQGERLGMLESRDGEMWRKVAGHIITAVVGAVVCYFLTQMGM